MTERFIPVFLESQARILKADLIKTNGLDVRKPLIKPELSFGHMFWNSRDVIEIATSFTDSLNLTEYIKRFSKTGNLDGKFTILPTRKWYNEKIPLQI